MSPVSQTPAAGRTFRRTAGWTLVALPLAVVWVRRHDVGRHRRTMMGLFYGGFAINLFIALIPGRTMWTMFFG